MNNNASDVMERVVARLVDAIEAGTDGWEMPWRTLGTHGWPTNAVTGTRYSGGNVLALHFAAIDRGDASARWATYKQWEALGGQVRQGERGTRCIYWHVKPADITTDPDPDTGETVELQTTARVAWARAFTVFNAAQVDNDPGAEPVPELTPLERDARVNAFFAAIPALVAWGAGNPCYQPATDRVVMPAFDAFHSTADAYATLAHELGHWTGHPTRLTRTYGRRFGDDAYAAEELVAELSAAFTCAVTGIDTVERTDHAAYLAHWCRMLKAQPAILWTVAAKAQSATDWLAAYSTTPAEGRD
jgi:antirestriction protein ArdC